MVAPNAVLPRGPVAMAVVTASGPMPHRAERAGDVAAAAVERDWTGGHSDSELMPCLVSRLEGAGSRPVV
ncbi:hypothetical protein [Streptomyces sp. R35]|uniref:Uncharacterized protein n=1 Tax=Streptomyces sp. R35 TaxID=3238630 RepID=A0AB39S1K4_9ACTN